MIDLPQRANVNLSGRHVAYVNRHGGPGKLSPLLRAVLDELYYAGKLGDLVKCQSESEMRNFMGALLRSKRKDANDDKRTTTTKAVAGE